MWELWIFCCLQKQRNDRARDFYAASLLKIFLIISLCSTTAISCKCLVLRRTGGSTEKEQLGLGWEEKRHVPLGTQWIPLSSVPFRNRYCRLELFFFKTLQFLHLSFHEDRCVPKSFAECMFLNTLFSWTSRPFPFKSLQLLFLGS